MSAHHTSPGRERRGTPTRADAARSSRPRVIHAATFIARGDSGNHPTLRDPRSSSADDDEIGHVHNWLGQPGAAPSAAERLRVRQVQMAVPAPANTARTTAPAAPSSKRDHRSTLARCTRTCTSSLTGMRNAFMPSLACLRPSRRLDWNVNPALEPGTPAHVPVPPTWRHPGSAMI